MILVVSNLLVIFFFAAIEGFLKTVFTQVPSQYGNMSYGSGSITDGTFKVPVQVTNFIPVAMQKGQAVRVTGTVSSEGIFYFFIFLFNKKKGHFKVSYNSFL